MRIFLVDDNAVVRTQMKRLLESRDDCIVVGEAADGRCAVEQWVRYSPNVTVMDFVMPEMNGLEAGRRLSQQHPESPVLMMTIDPSQQLAQEARKAGIKGLCGKADLRSLFSALDAVLKGKTYFQVGSVFAA